MASLIGAIRSSVEDSWWIIKLAVSVFIIYFAINQLPTLIKEPVVLGCIYFIMFFIFKGIAIIAMNRNINNKVPLYPGLKNIPEILTKAVGSFIITIFGYCVTYIVSSFIYTKSLIIWNDYIIKFLTSELDVDITNAQIIGFSVTLIFAIIIAIIIQIASLALSYIPEILYSARGRLSDGFNFKIIFKSMGNFIINFLILLIQILFIYGIIFTSLYFFLIQIFGIGHLISTILIYTFLVIIFFTSKIYLSDLYDDAIPSLEPRNLDF